MYLFLINALKTKYQKRYQNKVSLYLIFKAQYLTNIEVFVCFLVEPYPPSCWGKIPYFSGYYDAVLRTIATPEYRNAQVGAQNSKLMPNETGFNGRLKSRKIFFIS